MIEKAKNLMITLQEELMYNDQIEHYAKNLEATLWGLEEQAKMPENNTPEEQEAFVDQMNKCRVKIKVTRDLLSNHGLKVKQIIETALK